MMAATTASTAPGVAKRPARRLRCHRPRQRHPSGRPREQQREQPQAENGSI